MHDEFAGEGEDDSVEGHEGDVPEALAILGKLVGAGDGELVGEEDEVADWVAVGWVDREEEEEDADEGEGEDPGVL